MKMRFAAAFAGLAGCLVMGIGGGDPYLLGPEERHWTPVRDTVYLQERAERRPLPGAAVSVAVHAGEAYFVMDGALHRLTAEGHAAEEAPGPVERVISLGGSLWALGPDGLHQHGAEGWTRMLEGRPADLCLHLGAVHAAIGQDVYRLEDGEFRDIKPEGGYRSTNLTFEMEDGSQVLRRPVTWGHLLRLVSHHETLYGLRANGLAKLNNHAIDATVADWGALPSPRTRDAAALGARLFVATDRGLGVLRGMSMTSLRGPDGLPYEDTTRLVPGFADDLWIGTTRGAIRMLEEDWHYFGADHWLPGEQVHDIAVGERAVYIATDGGIGIVHYEPFTLAKKAAYYERHLEEWGHKRLGFTHQLFWGGDELGWVREISDNDGGHTAHYLAAMSFKYAATGDPAARAAARDSFEAMLWLEEITPMRGFPARAIWSTTSDPGPQAEGGSGGLPAKWWPAEDGLWEWKGDTSSDEVNAHFYAVSVFHDYAAHGGEKARAAEHLTRIMDHILENGWLLRDLDGEPTRWGRWDPEYLQRPYGNYARGLNGMEAQTYATTAYRLSGGDPKYAAALEQLLAWRYHEHTVRQKLTFPPNFNVPWDDRLAFECMFQLLRYAEDPNLRSIYARSLARHWEIKRLEQVPWYNFIYGVATGNDCEAELAVQHLRDWPLDPTSHSYRNSHRHDIHPQRDYVQYGAGIRAISPRESEAKRDSRSAFVLDGGMGGRRVVEPTAWLEDYWMGRYFGFILPPDTDDPALTTVEAWDGVHRGAAPYDGPPRPAILPQEE